MRFKGLIRARIVSLGLVAAMGFLLLALLVISAALAASSSYIAARLPAADLILHAINLVVSLVLISAMFAAIYKVLPDKPLEWRDVIVGDASVDFGDINGFVVLLSHG